MISRFMFDNICSKYLGVPMLGVKIIHMQKKCKKAKWLSEEALQIALKIREAKSKGENEKIFPFECRVPKNSQER